MQEADQHMRAVHHIAAKTDFRQEIREFYDGWADTYDKDMNSSHYGGPAAGAEAMAKILVDRTAPIVDCASGTGKVGQELALRGFSNIHAVDFSEKSLSISAEKGVYSRLIRAELGKGKVEELPDDYYSGLICVGAISIGHLSHEVFPEWNRVVKKGGYIVFTRSRLVYPDGPEGHGATMDTIQTAIDELIRTGVWEVVDTVTMDNDFCVGYGAVVYTIRRN